MRIRLLIALILQIVAVLFSFFTWIDPLEGGAAVLMVALITVAVRLIGKVRLPRLTWISLATAFAIAVVTIVIVTSRIEVTPSGEPHAVNLSQDLVILIWIYRAAAVSVIAGAVFYVLKIRDAWSHHR